jgi:hypothetical protein
VYPANAKYHRLQAHQTTFSSTAPPSSALADKLDLNVERHLQDGRSPSKRSAASTYVEQMTGRIFSAAPAKCAEPIPLVA